MGPTFVNYNAGPTENPKFKRCQMGARIWNYLIFWHFKNYEISKSENSGKGSKNFWPELQNLQASKLEKQAPNVKIQRPQPAGSSPPSVWGPDPDSARQLWVFDSCQRLKHLQRCGPPVINFDIAAQPSLGIGIHRSPDIDCADRDIKWTVPPLRQSIDGTPRHDQQHSTVC